MRMLVDTSVWSLAFRKKEINNEDQKIIAKLSKAIRELNIEIIGPIRQEILCGIKNTELFEELKVKLGVFKDLQINTQDYELAAESFNKCRSNGIQGSHIDFLICAVSVSNKLKIFTLAKDFENYKKYIPIKIEKIA